MGNVEQTGGTKSVITWTATQVYVMAVVCLLVGIAAGYLVRGSSTRSSATSAGAAMAPSPQAGMPSGTSDMGQVTPDQLKRMGDKKAESMLAELQKDPNNPDLLAQIGAVYLLTQQFPLAVEYYDRAAKIKPLAETFTSLASAYHYTGSDDRAIDALNRALTIDPKSPNALFRLGVLKWQAKNDPKGAIDAWQRLLKTNPNLPRRAEVEGLIAKVKEHINMPVANMPAAKTNKAAVE